MIEISLEEYCEQIESAIEQGRYAEAVAHGKHVLRHYSKHVATYRLLGTAMLEAGQDEYTVDMFRRVLSADPEDMLAWAGMSEVHNRRSEIDAAAWCLERAFELATENKVVEEELCHLYGRRDGVEAQRVQLTRGALARLYLRGDLLSRAIGEFRALLAEHPERVDLSIALAEALWRNDQRLEASEVCQQVLDMLPYCLKVNLILGEIWNSSGREEGQMYLRRAEALDPENKVAQELFGDASPLPAREVRIVPLEYQPPIKEELPAWMAEVEAVSAEGPPLTEREAALVDVAAALEAQIEIPSWLEEIGLSEEAPATVPPVTTPTGPSEEQLPEEAVPAPAEEAPEWLAGIREELVEERPEAVVEEETPEWLSGLGMESIGEEDILERLSELDVGPTGEEEAPAVLEEKEVPEWLSGLGAEVAGEEAVPSTPPAGESSDWLASLREQFVEEVEALEETPAPVAEEVPKPAWLEGEGLPSGDEALEWLERLAEGEEEKLRVQAEAEAEVRVAEIEEAVVEEAVAPPVGEAAVPQAEAGFGWTAFGEPGAPPEAAPAVEEIPPVEVPEEMDIPAPVAEEVPKPAWLEGEGLPSGDEALEWLERLAESREEKLRVQAEAEAEVRVAEIEEAVVEEALAPPVGEAVVPPAEAGFGWTAFGEPGAPPEAAPAVEEIPPVEVPEEMDIPAPVAEEVPKPAWLEGEGLPSGDEALEWLERLAESREEKLRVQAEAEAEVRVAEIEEAVVEEALAPPVGEAVVPPAEAGFGWTAFGEPEPPPVVEEAPQAEPAFGWTAFGEPEAPPEAIPTAEAVEEALPVEEEVVLPEVLEQVLPEEVKAPPTAEAPVVEERLPSEEILAPEVVPLTEEMRWGAVLEVSLEEAEVASAPVIEEVPGMPEMEITEPLEEAAAPPEIPTFEVPAEPFAAERAHLKEHPRDYEAWLALARALWQAGEQQEALEAYTRVIRVGKFLESVVPDLEEYVEQELDVSAQRLLGDAYMKDGRLQDALDIYRRALETL